jgi:membrane glycosyltransferase
VIDSGAALRLFLGTMTIVLMPKVLGLMLELKRVHRAREPMGAWRAVAGVVTETFFSVLLSPIYMVTQTVAVFQVLLGRDSGWHPQSRLGGGLSIIDVLLFHWRHMLLGAALAAICWYASGLLVAWMAPVIAGLLLAAPLSWLVARPAGPLMEAVLSTPDGRSPPSIVASARRASGEWAADAAAQAAEAAALQSAAPRAA